MSAAGRNYRLRDRRVRPLHPPTLLAASTVARLHNSVQNASPSHPAARLMRLLPAHPATLLLVGLALLLPEALTLAAGPSAVRLARPTVSSWMHTVLPLFIALKASQ